MVKKTSAYVDTGAFIAFLDRSDSYHPLFLRRFADPPPLVTTPLVIAEGHGWFLRRYDITRALQFLQFIADCTVLTILPVGPAELNESAKYLRRFSDHDLSLADACGLWIMKAHHVRVCWSTDHHLRLTGVPLVIDE